MNCTPQALIEASKCYNCIPPGMQGAVQAMLACEWAEGGAGGCDDPVVLDWLQRLANDFQPMPSADTIRAVCDFCTALRVDGIMDKMLVVNPIIPDSFLAMRYPLIYQVGNGNSPFINFNFVAADLDNNGLRGTGAGGAKYMDTGFIPSTKWADTPSGGISVYEAETSVSVQPDETDVGTYSTVPAAGDMLLVCYDNTILTLTYGEGWTVNTSVCSVAKADQPAFYSWDRTSDLLATLYMNNGAVIDTNNVDQSLATVPNKTTYFMALNENGVTNLWSGRRISFMAIHEGLTQSEVQSLYSAVYDLRVALGGGYVP